MTQERIEKEALNWNPQGSGRTGRPRVTWRTVEEEVMDRLRLRLPTESHGESSS